MWGEVRGETRSYPGAFLLRVLETHAADMSNSKYWSPGAPDHVRAVQELCPQQPEALHSHPWQIGSHPSQVGGAHGLEPHMLFGLRVDPKKSQGLEVRAP